MIPMVKKLFICLSTVLLSASVFSQNPVAENGQLQVVGHQLCNEQGKAFQLRGMSLFALMHLPQCITYNGFKTLKEDWNSNIVRAPIYMANYSSKNNYNESPEWNNTFIDSIVTWSERLGLYCIIDWHNDRYGSPNDPQHKGSDAFFELMSKKYAGKKNIIYEIINEPYGKTVSWDTIVNYANRIMPIIRKNDPKAIILVGCSEWDQKLEKIDTAKLKDNKNVMFTFHFYAASHRSLYNTFASQIHRIPVFVSEWGTCTSSGAGAIDTNTSSLFLRTMKQHISNNDTVTVSWCNFSFGDKDESASSLKPNSCYSGLWNNTTTEGTFVKYWLQNNSAPVVIPSEPSFIGNNEIENPFTIYPNPATNSLSVSTALATKVSVSIINILGVEVIAPVHFENDSIIDIHLLPEGIYFALFATEGKMTRRLFTKTK